MTIREIAALAGVSVSTVSKILNKKDEHLSAETRERVLKLVREYHYSPYSGVRAAVQAQTMLLGAAVNGNRPHGRLLDSITKYAAERGYSCVVTVSGTPEEELRNLNVLRSHHVDGILWDKLAQSLPACSTALEGIPVRKMACCEPPSPENSCIDYAGLAYQAAAYLIAQKHRDILCVIPQVSGYPEQAFVQGYRQCLFEHQVPFSPDRVCVCGKAGLPEGRLLENTAALCFDTELAGRVYEACSRKNRRIPKYLSVLSLSDGEKGPFFPELSVIPLPYDALARHVCDRLTADVEGRRVPETVFAAEAHLSGNTSVDIPLTMRNKKIVVVGPVNMDTVIPLKKFPQMGETTLTESRLIVPGGKGLNQAVGVTKLEAEAYLIGKVGKDYEGGNLYDYLQTNGVNTGGVSHTSQAATGHAYVYVQRDGESGIVVYKGANGLLTAQDILQNAAAFDNASFCLLQTEVGLDAVEAAAGLACERGVKLLLKPSAVYELRDELLQKIFVFLPNEKEISYFCPPEMSCKEKARYFLDRGVKNVILTMGRSGCYWDDGIHQVHFPAAPFEAVDTTGAADAFAAALAVMLSQNMDMETAIRSASFAAGFSTAKQGVPNSLIDRSTLEFYMGRECGEGETSPAHPGQFKKSAHSANQGVRSL